MLLINNTSQAVTAIIASHSVPEYPAFVDARYVVAKVLPSTVLAGNDPIPDDGALHVVSDAYYNACQGVNVTGDPRCLLSIGPVVLGGNVVGRIVVADDYHGGYSCVIRDGQLVE